MTWKISRECQCDDCGNPTIKKNPKRANDGKIRCKRCTGKRQRQLFKERHGSHYEKYAKGNERYRRRQKHQLLRLYYGMTLEQYESMRKAQDGKCAICGDSVDTLVVDHDHQTGAIRGLLCHGCNRVLGVFKDNIATFESAIAYLRKTVALPRVPKGESA